MGINMQWAMTFLAVSLRGKGVVKINYHASFQAVVNGRMVLKAVKQRARCG